MHHLSLALWLEAGDNRLLISVAITKERNKRWLWCNLATLDESSTVATYHDMKTSVKGYLYERKGNSNSKAGQIPHKYLSLSLQRWFVLFLFSTPLSETIKMPNSVFIAYSESDLYHVQR